LRNVTGFFLFEQGLWKDNLDAITISILFRNWFYIFAANEEKKDLQLFFANAMLCMY